jgi:t-SNARE complex subunit (syntaxin)
MGVIGAKERCLEILAYKYYLKNKKRSSKENWKLAIKMLDKLEKRARRDEKKKFPICFSILILLFILLVSFIITTVQ